MPPLLRRLPSSRARRRAKLTAATRRSEVLNDGIGAEAPIRVAAQDRLRRAEFAGRVAAVALALSDGASASAVGTRGSAILPFVIAIATFMVGAIVAERIGTAHAYLPLRPWRIRAALLETALLWVVALIAPRLDIANQTPSWMVFAIIALTAIAMPPRPEYHGWLASHRRTRNGAITHRGKNLLRRFTLQG